MPGSVSRACFGHLRQTFDDTSWKLVGVDDRRTWHEEEGLGTIEPRPVPPGQYRLEIASKEVEHEESFTLWPRADIRKKKDIKLPLNGGIKHHRTS